MRILKTYLVLPILVILALGCASYGTEPDSTASTMTQTPDPGTTDRWSRAEARRQARAYRRAEAQQATRQGVTYQTTTAQPRSRADRAIDVLRRSPLGSLGRWVGRGFRFLGPANPGPRAGTSTASTATATPTPTTPPSTETPGPTSQPGQGRIPIGRPVDPGTGIRSSATGTPTEAIPPAPRSTANPPEPDTKNRPEDVVLEVGPDGKPVVTNTTPPK